MSIDLSGIWNISLEANNRRKTGKIQIPGILQAQGYGNKIDKHTPWVSNLHDPYWYERTEYSIENKIPFLSQPPRHFMGVASYEREIDIDKDTREEWFLRIECTKWRTVSYIDGRKMDEDCSLCTAHVHRLGRIAKGKHILRIDIDNSMIYPYNPDGHGVSDALGATWNGMAGKVELMTYSELEALKKSRREYASKNPREIRINNGCFEINGHVEYMRGTHFGGEYPLTGYPITDINWWREKMDIVKNWGLNFIRCHSYCPPEAAFVAADEARIYLQPECGMWDYFGKDSELTGVLLEETRRILEEYGHHPSFVLFSPTNEPKGDWEDTLISWVLEARRIDRELGYEGRRVYTAESGWFYKEAPPQIQGVDYIYFHRSNWGPLFGGNIRGSVGWNGSDYRESLGDVDKPVICHEMGQWCAYPDFSVIDSFTGYLKPGNFIQFKENARRNGLLEINKELAWASGRNQVRLYKEDIEANLRTPYLYGFEMLDLHDYLGQGTALVGVLDAFWQEKGYVEPGEFRQFCQDVVILGRFESYVYDLKYTSVLKVPFELAWFRREEVPKELELKWTLKDKKDGEVLGTRSKTLLDGLVKAEKNYDLGTLEIDLESIVSKSACCDLEITLLWNDGHDYISNSWDITAFRDNKEDMDEAAYTRDWQIAYDRLSRGESVLYCPHLSELDFNCPSISVKNVFWNSQMGPNWDRTLGLLVDEEHALFNAFPSEKSGGWQWQDIIDHARAFNLNGKYATSRQPVRVIDDWNRNMPLALISEFNVKGAKLVIAGIDFETDIEKRVATRVLKKAILSYLSNDSVANAPLLTLDEAHSLVTSRLFPCKCMERIIKSVEYDSTASVENPLALLNSNPNQATLIKSAGMPATITVKLEGSKRVSGIVYLPDQRARYRTGFIKSFEIQVWDAFSGCYRRVAGGRFANESLAQTVSFKDVITDSIRLVVLDVYGDEGENICKLSKFHVITDDYDSSDICDELIWQAMTKEESSKRNTKKDIEEA